MPLLDHVSKFAGNVVSDVLASLRQGIAETSSEVCQQDWRLAQMQVFLQFADETFLGVGDEQTHELQQQPLETRLVHLHPLVLIYLPNTQHNNQKPIQQRSSARETPDKLALPRLYFGLPEEVNQLHVLLVIIDAVA